MGSVLWHFSSLVLHQHLVCVMYCTTLARLRACTDAMPLNFACTSLRMLFLGASLYITLLMVHCMS